MQMHICMQVRRRLAQNREAARKSRLRKKVLKKRIPVIHSLLGLIELILVFIFILFIGLCSTARNKSFEVGTTGTGT